jgi:uncharacterized protein YecE (DUF72 family)
MIKIGTSGFSFPDWINTVYPEGIKKDEMLKYYEEKLGFNTVELNSTYYALPSQKAIAGLFNKTSKNFEFSVKANKGMTHDLVCKDTGKVIDNKDVFSKFKYSIDPLVKENKFACVLMQFPYSFHLGKQTVEYIKNCKELLYPLPVVVEFRNREWHKIETFELLKKMDIGYCVVDEPHLKGLMPFCPVSTSEIGYFRFHGRNPNWFDSPLSVRYDYLYNGSELKSFIEPVKDVNKKVKKTLVYFNNCHAGSAAKNAIQLTKMLKESI